MKQKRVEATDFHEIVFQELFAILRKHATNLSPPELLALSANLCGKILAMQDQCTMTPDAAMELVVRNMEEGNRQAIESLAQINGVIQ